MEDGSAKQQREARADPHPARGREVRDGGGRGTAERGDKEGREGGDEPGMEVREVRERERDELEQG